MSERGRQEVQAFYDSAKWRQKSARVMSHYNYVDQVKKRFGKMIQADIVHHALPLEDFPEYAYHNDNLIPVSRATHRALHNDDGSLTAQGIEVAQRAARKIGVDISKYLSHHQHSKKFRPDAGRYIK